MTLNQIFRRVTLASITAAFLATNAIPIALIPLVHAAPPAPVITRGPGGPDKISLLPKASFEFNAGGTTTGYTFMCQLDAFGWDWCMQPSGKKGYANIPNGNHTFQVKAGTTYQDDDTGASYIEWGPITSYTWKSQGESKYAINPGDVSYGGSVIAVDSSSPNLTRGDTNGLTDVFVGYTNRGFYRASQSPSGAQGNGISFGPRLSKTGTVVAFQTRANNLVSGDTNAVDDVLIKDLWQNTLVRITNTTGSQIGPTGGIAYKQAATEPSISANGAKVSYTTYYGSSSNGGTANNKSDVYVYDIAQRKSVSYVGEGYGSSISRTGRYIAFTSPAKLLPTDTNNVTDIYLRDTKTNALQLISVNNAGVQANGDSQKPDISENGRYIAFETSANNMDPADTNGATDVFVRDISSKQTIWISRGGEKGSYAPSISGVQRTDKTFSVAFETDATRLCEDSRCFDENDKRDVVHWTGIDNNNPSRTTIISRKEYSLKTTTGTSSEAKISPDGSFVLFQSNALDSYTGNQYANKDTLMRGFWPYKLPDFKEKWEPPLEDPSLSFPEFIPPQREPDYPQAPQLPEPDAPPPLPPTDPSFLPNPGKTLADAWSGAVAGLMNAEEEPNQGYPSNDPETQDDKYGMYFPEVEPENSQELWGAKQEAATDARNTYDECMEQLSATWPNAREICVEFAQYIYGVRLEEYADIDWGNIEPALFKPTRPYCPAATIPNMNSSIAPFVTWPKAPLYL